MKSASRILGSIAVLFVIALVFLQGSSESSTPVAAQELSFSVSEPVTPHLSVAVRELPTGNAQPLLDREINPLKNPHFLSEGMGLKGSNSIGLDPLAELSRTSNTGNTPDTLFTFEGLGSDGFTPPDTVGDVGPNHYVQMVNVSFAMWEKNANPDLPPTLVQDDTLFNELFSGYGGVCESNNDGDPIVVYDELADRWLLSQFADPGGSHTMCIAISETPDPTGAYYLYDFQTPEFPDYFKFGVWEDGYYMSTNTGFPNQYYAFAFDRENMLAGQPATYQSFGGYPNFMMPSDLDGNTAPPTGSPNYFYTFFDSDYPDHPAGTDDRLAIYEFDVDWDTPANSTFGLVQEIPVAAYNYTVCGFFVGDCIPQPGTGQGIDSLSYWPMFRFAYRNQGSHEAMVGNFTVDLDGSDKAAIRWFELRKAGAADWALHQEGTHAPDDDHRWMGSIAMDSSGNIALGYSVSSETTFPSIRYATRLEGDPLGTLQAESSMLEGGGSQTGIHRWGDYSAMSIDPADGCTFWYTTEYHPADDQGFNWHTAIGTFRLDSCGTADFTLNASPPVQDVCVPNEAIFNVSVGQVQDYDDEVALTANNLPGAATAMFDPATLTPSTPPAMSMLTISNTASIAAGSYSVEIMGMAPTSTHTTTIGINIFDSTPLSATLASPADGATGAPLVPTFEWSAPAQGTDYNLEVASDIDFATVVYTATVDSTSHQIAAALDPLTTYYWRVRADNLCGEGAVSATWSFTTADIPPILLVDDDDNSPDVQSSYTDVLDALGLQYDIWDTNGSDNEPSAVDLAPYSMVIWFTGDSFGGSAGPGSAGEAALSAFLDSGQCLFISGQDYFYDRGLTPFMQEYLGVASAQSDVAQTTVTGEGILFGGLGPYSLSYPFTNYSDVVTPDATAELAFSGDIGDAAVDKDSGVYRTTFFGYPFEALPVGSDQETVMQTIVDWCGTGVATGTLEGTVTDLDSGDGIEGATITADDGSTQRTTSTDEDGGYSMRLAIGTYDVMATADIYTSDMITDVVIMTDTTSTANFVLQGSSLTYSPAEIEEDMEIGDVVTTTVTVTATGPLSVSFDINIGNFGGPGESLISIPASDGNFPRGEAAPSFGRPPIQNNQPEPQNPVNLSQILGSSAYATDAGQGFFGSFDVEVGGTLTNIGPFANFVWAGDFLGGDFSMAYVLNSDTNMLEMVSTSDASQTPIGPSIPAGAESWTGMAGDPTSGLLYASACDVSVSSIYMMDTSTGEATRIAPISNSPCTIAIAIDDSGQMYGYDITNDSLMSIDKATGEGTIIGSLGFDANFGQGMDYDSASGNLYLSAFNNGIGQAELRIADTTTGNTTLVDVLGTPGVSQLGWMATASGGSGGASNWAYAVPDSGTVNANGTTTFDVVFDARSLIEVGQYTAELSFNGSFVNDVETMPLTMNLTCPSCGFLDGSITDLETGDAINAQIHITSSNGFDVMLSGESYDIAVQPGDYNISVSANGYLDESESVTVSAGETLTTDFVLTPMIAMLEYTPAEIEEDMEIGDIVINTVTVQNTGYVDLEFNVNIGGYDGPGIQVVPHSISLPASDGNFPHGTHAPSFAQAPIDSAKVEQGSSASEILGSSAYATDAGQGFFAEFDVEVGGGLNNIGSFTDFVWAGDFLGGDFEMAYLISDANMLEMVSTSDASRTPIGSSIPSGAESWTGMAGDPTSGLLYASACDVSVSSIYMIDTNTGEATRIAPISNSPCTIAIAIDDSGQMYGYDIINDSLMTIDKATGEGTIIGSLGFDANFGQGMDYDSASGNLYLSAFNNGIGQAELRIADTTTGNTTLVDVLGTPGVSQLGWMAAASGGGNAATAWASADPDSGIVPAGETMTFDVVFDATALYQEGDYTANLSFSGNFVNDVEAMPLTMHITCPTCGLLEGSITDAHTGDPLGASINVMGDDVEINVSGESYSLALPAGDYDITVSANDYFDESATVSAVMGETTVTDFALTPIIALLDYMPDSFEQTVTVGEMASQELMIENDGTIAFDFGLSDVEIGTPEGTMAAPMITCPEDEFGYSCTDSNEPGGPTYNFEDISATGSAIALGDDQVSDPIPLGFMFNFYEEDYSDIYVSSNGFLTVLAGQDSGCCSGQVMPTAGDPDGVIAGWWEDLNPSAGGTIHHETVGTAPNRRLIVQFTSVPHYSDGNEVTMQYKLFESSNIIEVHYESAPSDGGTHSAGIENQDGTSGVQYHNGIEALVTPLAVRYQTYQDAAWLEQEPMTGTVEADDSMMIDIIFNATEITQTGTYTASLRIDGTFDNPGALIPVVMHVEDPAPEMEIDLEVPEMTIESGQEMSQTLTLSNTGNVALDWEAFTEEGAARLVVGGECSGNNTELGWMTLNPTSGTLPPGETHGIEVMVDSTGLEAGDHDGNVCITLPAHDHTMTIPAVLTVMPATAVEMTELNAAGSSYNLPLGLLAAGMLLLVAGGYVAQRRRES